MPTIELNGHAYVVDEDGFLEDPMIWNEGVAADLARAHPDRDRSPERPAIM